MDNIEKLKRVLTKELVGENVDIIRYVEKLEINPANISGMYGNYLLNDTFKIKYLIALNVEEYRNMEVELSINLIDIKKSKDSEEEKELLAILIQEHLEKLEDKVKHQINKIDFQNNYVNEVTEKVQQYFDSKNKFKSEFGLKDGNLYVTGSGFKYMNTPYKPEVLVTPDGLETVVEDDESKTSIVYKGKRTICKVEKKPIEQVKLGSLTLQEKDGKLAVTDKNGSTRFI